MIDDRTCTRRDQNAFTGEFIWTRDSNRFGWASFLGADVEPIGNGHQPLFEDVNFEPVAWERLRRA